VPRSLSDKLNRADGPPSPSHERRLFIGVRERKRARQRDRDREREGERESKRRLSLFGSKERR
jgi:hypothetical protein